MNGAWLKKTVLTGACVAAVSGLYAWAQGGPPGEPGQGQHPPKHPIETALDANGDGVIDAAEIAKASVALKKLDKNGDGKLTPDEYRPPRPPRQDGPGPGGPQAP